MQESRYQSRVNPPLFSAEQAAHQPSHHGIATHAARGQYPIGIADKLFDQPVCWSSSLLLLPRPKQSKTKFQGESTCTRPFTGLC